MSTQQSYRDVIIVAKRGLTRADLRLNEDAAVAMLACLDGFEQPDFAAQIASDYGVSPEGDSEVAQEFWEEIEAIEGAIDEGGVEIGLADWQKGRTSGAAKKMHQSLNRRAYAMQLWEWYAVPARFCNGQIVMLWPPRDVMGSPIVRRYFPQYFIAEWATVQSEQNVARVRSEDRAKKREGLLWAASGTLAVSCLVLFLALIR